jgi:hypothetical protein
MNHALWMMLRSGRLDEDGAMEADSAGIRVTEAPAGGVWGAPAVDLVE